MQVILMPSYCRLCSKHSRNHVTIKHVSVSLEQTYLANCCRAYLLLHKYKMSSIIQLYFIRETEHFLSLLAEIVSWTFTFSTTTVSQRVLLTVKIAQQVQKIALDYTQIKKKMFMHLYIYLDIHCWWLSLQVNLFLDARTGKTSLYYCDLFVENVMWQDLFILPYLLFLAVQLNISSSYTCLWSHVIDLKVTSMTMFFCNAIF